MTSVTGGEHTRTLPLEAFLLDQALGALLRSAMAGTRLSPSEYALASVIAEGGRSSTALAGEFSVPLTTMIDWLSRLQERGLVSRDRNPADRREWAHHLTTDGCAAMDEARERFGLAYRSFLDCATASESEMMRHLQAMTTAARAAAARIPLDPR